MVHEKLGPEKIITEKSVANASAVAMATGCSTNAVVHLIAMARRAGVPLTLEDLDGISRTTPVIANIRPSGKQYLMEDFYYAGGLRALMAEMKELLHLDAMTVSGFPLGATLEGAEVHNSDVIRPLSNPIYHEGSLAVLKGNLAPDGCVVKPSACEERLRVHEGPALVFDSYPEMKAAIDDEDLDVTPDHVLILRNAGPKGGPGMPEWGMLPIPKKILKQGYRDMLRISDARMSGTSYGACILHVAPESHIGGPLSLVQHRRHHPRRRAEPDDRHAGRRRYARDAPAAWTRPADKYERGYGWMFYQAHQAGQRRLRLRLPRNRSSAPAVGEPDIF
jgi:dihydroxyacid dehydratase/phosphogluconate dehydratase